MQKKNKARYGWLKFATVSGLALLLVGDAIPRVTGLRP
jgi:hypothetical protein